MAFEDVPESAHWLDSKRAEELLHLHPDGNVHASSASHFLGEVMSGFDELRPRLDQVAVERGEELLEAHRRVRTASRMKGVTCRVEPQLPPDVLGIYVYLPKA